MTREDLLLSWYQARAMLALSGGLKLEISGIPFKAGTRLNIHFYPHAPHVIVEVQCGCGAWDWKGQQALITSLDEIMPGQRRQTGLDERAGLAYFDGNTQIACVYFDW